MAKLFPHLFPFPDDDMRWAEKQAFNAFSQLADDWTVIYSLSWHGNRNQKTGDGEADFLLIHPRYGFMIAEIKGGSEIRVTDGEWFSKRRGQWVSIKDPFEQAVASSNELKKWLEKALPHIKFPPFMHFVVFPAHTQKGDMSPAGRREIICDDNDLASADRTIRSIASHWNRSCNLSEQDISEIRQALRPDITIFSNRKLQMEEAQEQITLLTNQQLAIIEALRRQTKLLVMGTAGTGKTVLALNSAKALAAAGNNTLLLCFNTPLAQFLKGESKGIKNLTTDSFHGLANRLIDESGLSYDDEEELPLMLIEAADMLRIKFDAIVVDEAQDFQSDWWDALNDMYPSEGKPILHVFADSNQNIYEGAGVERFAGMDPIELTKNCRNTIEIARIVHDCGHIATEPSSTHGPSPTVELVSARSGINRQLATYLKQWVEEMRIPTSDLAVITDSGQLADDLFGSEIAGFEFGDGSKNTIQVDTIQRFKGLEAEAVICIFDPDKQDGQSDEALERLAYIGLSRAKALLVVLGNAKVQERLSNLTD